MACDPNTLLNESRQFLSLTQEQLALSVVSLLVDAVEAGGFPPMGGDFRITEADEIRETEDGSFRIIE
jgi:hypothetical protein